MAETLGEALPREMTRVRNLIPLYAELPGGVGRFAIAMMNADLDRAQKALAEGDIIEMIAAYQSLKEFTV